MYKKGLGIMGVFMILMVVSTILYVTQLKIENVSAYAQEETVVLSNKVWTLTFTEKLEKNTINDQTVYVTNTNGEKVQTTIFLSEDLKTLNVQPPKEGYDLSSESYTLHLGKEIKSLYGRGLGAKKEISFVVKETLPLVGSKEKLNKHFLTIIEEQKKDRKFRLFAEDGVKEESAEAEKSSESLDVSETNTQVQGVDESDIVKTNGTHIFQVVDGKINIINASIPTNMSVDSTIDFKRSFSPYQLFLENDRLVVIGHSYEEMKQSSSKQSVDSKIAPIYESTKAVVYNIKDPKNLKVEREILLEGGFVSSRKIDNIVYLITNNQPQYWVLEEDETYDLRPRYSDSAISEEIKLIDYDEIQYFPSSKESNYTIITSFDLNKPSSEATITTYLGSGRQLYMSRENLFLAVEDWSDMIGERGEFNSPDTNIYKFGVNGTDVEYHSSTEVQGTILNQFSMDEHNGYFRVATTKGNTWDNDRPSDNNLFIFDKDLNKVGELTDLAKGERIYSARFMGDRIYIVTFKETDPLFVIDASKPDQPSVLGELKIPGFSNYLHPYDENHLIGFGHDTKLISQKGSNEPLVLTNGVKISMFDITDVTNPKEKFTEVIGGRGTYSPLNYDHKALLFNKSKNLFGFPINVYQNVEGSQYEQTFEFQGAYVYQIDVNKGFQLKTKISHLEGKSPYEEWESGVQRLLYIGEILYVISPSKITSHQLSDYNLVDELSLR
ncbi:beta-propeller domain-containing protein [Cytobacillus sp. FJAT-54145]|uniref:Beta-propeller domain-containing protein n=1 Tax=Cytobacillus spartinae TaxID=3299023 RepID=A0ABW6KEZ2_9BACI